jgi:hypothetical protein
MKPIIKKILKEVLNTLVKNDVETNLRMELFKLSELNLSETELEKKLIDIENKYGKFFSDYPGDNYKIIDIILRNLPYKLVAFYRDMHSRL